MYEVGDVTGGEVGVWHVTDALGKIQRVVETPHNG